MNHVHAILVKYRKTDNGKSSNSIICWNHVLNDPAGKSGVDKMIVIESKSKGF